MAPQVHISLYLFIYVSVYMHVQHICICPSRYAYVQKCWLICIYTFCSVNMEQLTSRYAYIQKTFLIICIPTGPSWGICMGAPVQVQDIYCVRVGQSLIQSQVQSQSSHRYRGIVLVSIGPSSNLQYMLKRLKG